MMARATAASKGGVGPVAIGPNRVRGAVVNVLAAGSLLRCKPFVAHGAAQASLSQAEGRRDDRSQDAQAEQRRCSQG